MSSSLPTADGDQRVVSLGPTLAVAIVAHTLQGRTGPAPCWTVVSEGFRSGVELAATVRRDRGSELRPLLAFLAALDPIAVDEPPRIGTQTTIGPGEGLLGDGRFFTVLYAPPQPIANVPGTGEALTCILLRPEEAEALYRSGPLRILARLGEQERFFPTTPWADPLRPPVVDAVAEATSVLDPVAALFVPGLRATRVDGTTVEVGVSPLDRERLLQIRSHPGPVDAVKLLVGPTTAADAILVYRPGAPTTAISATDSMARLALNAVVLTRADHDWATLAEDALALGLGPAAWDRAWDALESAGTLELTTEGPIATVRFGSALVGIVDPVRGTTMFGEWSTHRPAGGAEERVPSDPVAELRETVLMTSETVLAERVAVEPLAAALGEIVAAIRARCLQWPPTPALLTVDIAYDPGGCALYKFASDPAQDDPRWLRSLEDVLRTVAVPEVRGGPVELQARICLGGYAT